MAHLRVPTGLAYRIPRSRHRTDGHLRRVVDRGGQRRRGRGRAPDARTGLCGCSICSAKAKLRPPSCILAAIPRLVLCEQDTGDEGEFGFVQIHVAGLFKIWVRVAENRQAGARLVPRMAVWL